VSADQQTAEQTGDPFITLRLRLSSVNFTLQTLDRNPLGAPVMQTANLIADLRRQTETAVAQASEPKVAVEEVQTNSAQRRARK